MNDYNPRVALGFFLKFHSSLITYLPLGLYSFISATFQSALNRKEPQLFVFVLYVTVFCYLVCNVLSLYCM
ncbi:hypothetical protein HanIR_Chr03g0124121 [Helianthus annuus]|nr:hypothetical protein HanIR_Chr03g0124121 [Helianthus annuus]